MSLGNPLPLAGAVSLLNNPAIPYLQAMLYGKSTATVKTVNVPNPAAGSIWQISPPAATIWQILCGSWTFVASGVAGNRIPNIFSETGAAVLSNDLSRTTVTVGQTVRINSFPGAQTAADITTGNINIFLAIPGPLLLDNNDTLNGGAAGLLAGDQLSAINFKVIEYK